MKREGWGISQPRPVISLSALLCSERHAPLVFPWSFSITQYLRLSLISILLLDWQSPLYFGCPSANYIDIFAPTLSYGCPPVYIQKGCLSWADHFSLLSSYSCKTVSSHPDRLAEAALKVSVCFHIFCLLLISNPKLVKWPAIPHSAHMTVLSLTERKTWQHDKHDITSADALVWAWALEPAGDSCRALPN